ncbi:MAG TPA: hypothetical protein VK427_22450 [Kofleriaceae bacterium]|nr:hypothetical protein [Kofleriaceae bacterium]
MRHLVACCILALACKSEPAAPPARWEAVERLATPGIPGGDGTLLAQALDRVDGDDVPERALEDAIAWRKMAGGLPWRSGRTLADRQVVRAMKLGTALLDRRGDDTEAVLTVLYLAHRLRGEAPGLIDITVGFTLAGKVIAKRLPYQPTYAGFAPTEAEARRAIPAEAVSLSRMIASTPDDRAGVGDHVRQYYARMLVGAPTERAAYLAHVAAATAKAKQDPVLSVVVSPRLPELASQMFQTIDAYRAWAR